MQVNNDAPPPNAGAKDEVRSGAGDAADAGTPRTGRKFRTALERGHRAGAVVHDGACAAAMAGWFRPESGAPSPPAGPARVAAASAPRSIDRILIGAGPDGAEARIRIGAGALAGSEIQLSSGAAGNAVEARLLTHAACSRQTLSLVMDEIRLRLRDRGIVLSTKVPAGRPAPAASGADATKDDRDAPPGSSA